MAVEIKVPDLSESVIEATVADWLKQEGDAVEAGEAVVVLETDKVSVEVVAEASGVLASIVAPAGEDVEAGAVLGTIDGEAVATPAASAAAASTQGAPTPTPAAPQPQAAPPAVGMSVTPVAQRMASEHGVDLSQVDATGDKITKEDVQKFISNGGSQPKPASAPTRPATPAASAPAGLPAFSDDRDEERVRMSRRRRTIASRLVEVQQTAAMLTTFNEIDMSAVMELRKRRKEAFKEKFGVSLGLSSFFVKATIGALKAFPRVNAEIQENEMVIKQYYDIGIAIGAEEGLIVPVLRNADRKSFAEIEGEIRKFAKQSQEGLLSVEDLMGGTFTITNGGVFGSMMSTPILNPPQVGILGLHGITDRPVVVDGEIVVRPMMYVALTYDHRIVDGREAVQFLVRVKQLIEDPESLLIEG